MVQAHIADSTVANLSARRGSLYPRSEKEYILEHFQIFQCPSNDQATMSRALYFEEQSSTIINSIRNSNSGYVPLDWQGQILLLMRGLPGSGKTNFAAEVQYFATINGLRCVICSADHQFRSRFGDRFNPADLRFAHATCQNRFEEAITNNADVIIIDNCNIREDEFQYYVDRGNALRIRYQVIQFECQSEAIAVELGHRSTSRIDGEYMRRRFNQYDQAHFQGYFRRRGINPDERVTIVDPFADPEAW